jgi:hypothetical protein
MLVAMDCLFLKFNKEFIMKKLLLTLIAFIAIFYASSVMAVVIDFDLYSDIDANHATDGSGLTSRFVPSSNLLNPLHGYFIETFDGATAMPGFPTGTTTYNHPTDNEGCMFNSAGAPGISVSTTGGGFEIRANHAPGVAAVPGGDPSQGGVGGTCFGYTPSEGGDPGSVTVDYTGFLLGNGNAKIDYLGFYWGSVDTYNDFLFYDGEELLTTITGASLLGQLGGSSGDQVDEASNVYVNLFFDLDESFTSFRVNSTGIAGEFDNIVIGLTNRPIPAPETLALLGLGLIGLGLSKKYIA